MQKKYKKVSAVLKVFITGRLNHSQLFEMINMQLCNARINLKIV